jgi:hypothetical protein
MGSRWWDDERRSGLEKMRTEGHLLPAVVNDEDDVVESDAGLSDVRGQDDLQNSLRW